MLSKADHKGCQPPPWMVWLMLLLMLACVCGACRAGDLEELGPRCGETDTGEPECAAVCTACCEGPEWCPEGCEGCGREWCAGGCGGMCTGG